MRDREAVIGNVPSSKAKQGHWRKGKLIRRNFILKIKVEFRLISKKIFNYDSMDSINQLLSVN